MLVHEALARMTGRRPVFGDPQDIEASNLIVLFVRASAALRERLTVPEHLEMRLAALQQADAPTLQSIIHPPHKRRKGMPHGS